MADFRREQWFLDWKWELEDKISKGEDALWEVRNGFDTEWNGFEWDGNEDTQDEAIEKVEAMLADLGDELEDLETGFHGRI